MKEEDGTIDQNYSHHLLLLMIHRIAIALQVRLENVVDPTLTWASSTPLYQDNTIWEAKSHEGRKHPYMDSPRFPYVSMRFGQRDISTTLSIDMLELISTPFFFVTPPPNSFSDILSQCRMISDLSFCPPVDRKETDMINVSMLFGQMQRSMLLQSDTFNVLRDIRPLPKLSSSFSPKLTKFSQ
ncbi:hypothetical protein OSB04_011212 [Centaurea solstitialis]|uniref:Uncharacterized protein n=1 Tax=Centaurea solstitialis TaxID=347529 RepID=A0AA38TTR7_9ASTR|nr:hypothetical protein OSB04_011212 [Centaurea solstitialis]